ncbi:MAG TPA: response regulator [Candidatus Dormibacteraeota bacterium]|nr:response regulator [Candidatus Dormibacteraeota bacterium]
MNGETAILLVEDNPSDAKLTLRCLGSKGAGIKIDHVRDGQAALDYLFCEGSFAERDPGLGPRLVLLDIKLPKLDGLTVLERVRADPRTAALPIVILTSSKQEGDIANSYHLGVNSYIVKPVDYAKFNEAVRNIGTYWLRTNTQPALLGRA